MNCIKKQYHENGIKILSISFEQEAKSSKNHFRPEIITICDVWKLHMSVQIIKKRETRKLYLNSIEGILVYSVLFKYIRKLQRVNLKKLNVDFKIVYLVTKLSQKIMKIIKQAIIYVILRKWCLLNDFFNRSTLHRICRVFHWPWIIILKKCSLFESAYVMLA